MSETSMYISELLQETFYDFTEEYDELLNDWYGDDLSIFNPDDEDLYDVVKRLTRKIRFWCTSPNPPLSSYEKLRRKYESLLAIHSRLIEAHCSLRDENEQLAKAFRHGQRKNITTKIKYGCGCAMERRYEKNDEESVA